MRVELSQFVLQHHIEEAVPLHGQPCLFSASNHAVVFLEGIQSHHLFDPVSSLLQNFGLSTKNSVRIFRYIDAACLDRHQELFPLLEKRVKVLGQYSCLVRLRDVAVNGIDFRDETAISAWKSRVLKDRYCIGPVFGNVVD